jgi:hypothetical protein
VLFTTTYTQTATFGQLVSLLFGQNVTSEENPSRATSPETNVRQMPKSKEPSNIAVRSIGLCWPRFGVFYLAPIFVTLAGNLGAPKALNKRTGEQISASRSGGNSGSGRWSLLRESVQSANA